MPWPRGWACGRGRSKGRRISASSIPCCSRCSGRPGSSPAASARTTRTWWSRVSRCAPSSSSPHRAPASCACARRSADGTPVLQGTASVAMPDGIRTSSQQRIAKLRPANGLVINRDLKVGQRGAGRREDPHGLRPAHGRPLPVHAGRQARGHYRAVRLVHAPKAAQQLALGARPIIPTEMISVLLGSTSAGAGFRGRKPAVGLFAGQEIRLGEGTAVRRSADYELEREIIALSESARTESVWIPPGSTVRRRARWWPR